MFEPRPERWAPPPGALEARLTQPEREDAWRDLLFIGAKWLPEMALIVVLSLACGLVYLGLIRSSLYEATAKLYVRIGVDQAPSPLLGSDRSVTYLAQARGAVQSEVDMLRNDALVGRLIDGLDLSPDPKPEPATILETVKRLGQDAYASLRATFDRGLIALNLKSQLTPKEEMRLTLFSSILVDSSTNSDVVTVALRWPDKEQATALLKRYLDNYIAFRSSVFEGEGEIAFLSAKRDDAKREAEQLEARMAAFEQTHNIRNASNRAQLLESELIEAQRADERASLDLALARGRLTRLDDRMPDNRDGPGLGAFPADSPTAPMAGALVGLLGERARLLAGNAVEAPAVREIEARLRALVGVLRRQIGSEIEDRARTSAAARERLDRTAASLRDLQAATAAWKALERRRELTEPRWRDAEKRLSESRDIDALRRSRLSNVALVQPATASPLPVGLRNMTLLTMIGIVSLIAAAGWALLRELLDARLHHANAAAHLLGLPVLGDLPENGRPVSEWVLPR